MLVLDPLKRYTIEQIRRHRWLAGAGAGGRAEPPRSPARAGAGPGPVDPNDQVLRLMQSLGIDPAKTKEVIILFFYR